MTRRLILGLVALALSGSTLAATDYPSGYTKCAQVGSVCSMSGTHSVALGKSGSFVYATLTGSFTCSTSLFPSNSFTSSAWCSVGPSATSSSSSVASSAAASSKASSSAAASSKASSSAASSAAASSTASSSAASSAQAASSASTSWRASTSTRPQLSDAVAANYTVAKYLGSWTPAAISTPSSPDYTVSSSGTYKTVQSAINAAINAGGSTRKYILVSPGTYNELVFVPSGTPITLYGTGAASAVKIQIATSALLTGTQYAAMVNASNYTSAGQSWVNGCAGKGSSAIGTTCSSAFIIQNTGFEAKNLTITNSRVESGSGTDQSVAVYTIADQVHFDNVYLYGNQDTLWVDGSGKRFYDQNCYVEGDVDFIFGQGTAVFDNCQINYTAARGKNGSTIGAPSTTASNYGILINGGSITGSNGASGVYFGRQWPQSSLSSPVGKMIIRDAKITLSINSSAPWEDWSSSNKVNYGTTSSPYLGEYHNTGN